MPKTSNHTVRLLHYIRPYWKQLTLALLFASIVSLTTGGIAWLVKPILDDVFLKKDTSKLLMVPLLFVFLYFSKGVCRYGQTVLMRTVGLKVVMAIRNDLYSHILKMPVAFFQKNTSPVLMSRVTNDVSRVTEVATSVVAECVRQILTFFVLIVVIFYQDWFLSTLALFVFPFVFGFIYRIGKKIKELSRKNQAKMADLNSILHETFTGIKIVKAFTMEEYELKRFYDENRILYDLSVKEAKKDEIISPFMEFLGSLGAGLVIFYGGQQVLAGNTTPGTFFSFLAALTMLYEPIRKLSKMNNVVQHALAAGERIFEVMDQEVAISDKPEARAIESFSSGIEFRDLRFRYTEGHDDVLKGINLKVSKGEVIAVVGNSGAGKSTMMDLLPRYYDPSEGAILIDGIDIREIKLASLREMMGVVTQETILFNDTVRNNISYGRRGALNDEVVKAARLAYADKFIMDMPEGYDTIIGERGVRLSGGERQRLSIARAILKNPQILLLDEATSNLDSESESLVQQALENLMQERTTFVIAHRLSTIINSDKIIVVNDGLIVECGTHSELLEKQGYYRSLYDIQYKR